NPICAEMGRKFKISFSSSDKDTAFSYIHDFGFIPKVRIVDGKEERGFKVMLGGGLGAQPILAHEVYDFLPEDEILPYAEATIHVFDRYREQKNRNKAIFKFLVQKLGLETILNLIEEEKIPVKHKLVPFDIDAISPPDPPAKEAEEET